MLVCSLQSFLSAVLEYCTSVIALCSQETKLVDCNSLVITQSIFIFTTRGQSYHKYKANSARASNIAVREQDFNRSSGAESEGPAGDELRGTERGPVDREGARSTKSKHSTSSIRGLRVGPASFACL